MAAPFSSGAAATAASSPPPEPYLLPHDWELLPAPNPMSSSVLLAHGHGLGLPHRSGTTFQRDDDQGNDFRDGDSASSDANLMVLSVGDENSLPVDVSQIAAMCSSTSGIEPFTEGWKPQFRIAGAALQEDHYLPDPMVVASTILERSQHQSEPFLVMDQTFLAELVQDANTGMEECEVSTSPKMKAGRRTENLEKDEAVDDENERELIATDEDGSYQKGASFECAEAAKRKATLAPGKCAWWNRQTLLYRKSHIVWSVALTATLLGVLLITRRFQADRHELLVDISKRDEK